MTRLGDQFLSNPVKPILIQVSIHAGKGFLCADGEPHDFEP